MPQEETRHDDAGPDAAVNSSTASSSSSRTDRLARGRALFHKFQERRRSSSQGAIPRAAAAFVASGGDSSAADLSGLDDNSISLLRQRDRGQRIFHDRKSGNVSGLSQVSGIDASDSQYTESLLGAAGLSTPTPAGRPPMGPVTSSSSHQPHPHQSPSPSHTATNGSSADRVLIEQLRGELAATKRLLTLARQEREDVQGKLEEVQQDASTAHHPDQGPSTTDTSALKKELEDAVQKNNALALEKETLEAKLAEFAGQCASLKSEKNALEAGCQRSQRDLEATTTEHQRQLLNLHSEMDMKGSRLTYLKDQLEDYQAQCSVLREALQGKDLHLSKIKAVEESTQAQLNRLEKDIVALNNTVAEKDRRIQSLNEELAMEKKHFHVQSNTLKEDNYTMGTQLEKSNSDLNSVHRRLHETEAALTASSNESAEYRAELSHLRMQLQAKNESPQKEAAAAAGEEPDEAQEQILHQRIHAAEEAHRAASQEAARFQSEVEAVKAQLTAATEKHRTAEQHHAAELDSLNTKFRETTAALKLELSAEGDRLAQQAAQHREELQTREEAIVTDRAAMTATFAVQMGELRKELSDMTTRHQEDSNLLAQQHQAEVERLQAKSEAERRRLEDELHQLKESTEGTTEESQQRAMHLAEEVSRLQKQLAASNESREDLEHHSRDARVTIETLQRDAEQLEDAIVTQQAAAAAERESLQTQLSDMTTRHQEDSNLLAQQHQAEVERLQAKSELERRRLEDELHQLKESTEGTAEESQQRAMHLAEEVSRLQKQLAASNESREDLEHHSRDATVKIETLQRDAEQLTSKNEQLHRSLEADQAVAAAERESLQTQLSQAVERAANERSLRNIAEASLEAARETITDLEGANYASPSSQLQSRSPPTTPDVTTVELREKLVEAERRCLQFSTELEVSHSEQQRLHEALESKSAMLVEMDASILSDGRDHQLDREQITQQAERLDELEVRAQEATARSDSLEEERYRLREELIQAQGRSEAKESVVKRLETEKQTLRTQLAAAKQDVLRRANVNTGLQQDLLDLQRANNTLDDTVTALHTERHGLYLAMDTSNWAEEMLEERYLDAIGDALEARAKVLDTAVAGWNDAVADTAAAHCELQAVHEKCAACEKGYDEELTHVMELLDLVKDHEVSYATLKNEQAQEDVMFDESYARHEVEHDNMLSRFVFSQYTASFWREQTLSWQHRTHAVTKERDDIRDGAAHAREQEKNLRSRLEQNFTDLQKTLDSVSAELSKVRAEKEADDAVLAATAAQQAAALRELERQLAIAREERSVALGAKESVDHKLQSKIDSLTAAEQRLSEVESDRNALKSSSTRLAEELQSLSSDTQRKLKESKQQLMERDAEVRSLTSQLKEEKDDAAAAQAEVKTLSRKLTDATEECAELKGTIRELTGEMKATTSRMRELEDSTANTTSEIAHKDDTIATLRISVHELREAQKQHETIVYEKDHEIQRLMRECDDVHEKLREQQSTFDDSSMQIQQSVKQLEDLRSALSEAEMSAADAHGKVKYLEDRIAKLEQDAASTAEATSGKVAQLTAQLDATTVALRAAESVADQRVKDIQSTAESARSSLATLTGELKIAKSDADEARTEHRAVQQQLRHTEGERDTALRQLRSAVDDVDRLRQEMNALRNTHERDAAHLKATFAEEQRGALGTVEKLLQAERQAVQDTRQSQHSAMRFVEQLQKEKQILEGKAAGLRSEVQTANRTLMEQRQELSSIHSVAAECSQQLATQTGGSSTTHMMGAVEVMNELLKRLLGDQSNATDSVFVEAVQCDELHRLLERHAAQSAAVGTAVHRVFTTLRRAIESLKRRKPNKEADPAGFNRYKIQKAALEHLEQQNMAVERCTRSAVAFHAEAKSHAESLQQHVQSVEAATSSAIPPTLQVAHSIRQQKVYIGAKAHALLTHTSNQHQALKDIRDAYNIWERDFSQNGIQLMLFAQAARGAASSSGRSASQSSHQSASAATGVEEIPVPVIVEKLDQKLNVFADGEEWVRNPLVMSVPDFHEEQLQQFQNAAAGVVSPVAQHPHHHHHRSSHNTSQQLRRANSQDDELGVTTEDSDPERESPVSDDVDDSATWPEAQRKQVKTSHENQRLYRLVRTLNAKLKAESQRARQLQALLDPSGGSAVGGGAPSGEVSPIPQQIPEELQVDEDVDVVRGESGESHRTPSNSRERSSRTRGGTAADDEAFAGELSDDNHNAALESSPEEDDDGVVWVGQEELH